MITIKNMSRVVRQENFNAQSLSPNTVQLLTGKVQIGDYRILQPANGKVWISRAGGEGGTFDAKELEKLIEEFFQKRF